MTTLVVSDLHLGGRTGADVLRHPQARAALLAELAGVEELVLLGDTLELRHGPLHQALDAARPFFEELGDALDADARVVLVPGNHDHVLGEPWLERRRGDAGGPLGLDERAPPQPGDVAATLAQWLGGPALTLAYPGLWLREDVYATHGHYLDCHITVPTFERLVAGAMARVVGQLPSPSCTPDDYEAALAPVYAWMHALAQAAPPDRTFGRHGSQARVWQTLVNESGHRPMRTRLLRAAVPLSVGVLNRLGLGPLRAELSGPSLRRAGLEAAAESLVRLGVRCEHAIFGHTHRAGPMPRDDPSEWLTRTGTRMVNSGSWVYERAFLGPSADGNPYWPGTCVRVDAQGPPQLRRLLDDRTAAELRDG